MKKQNKKMYYYRDQLQRQLKKTELQDLLESNGQEICPGVDSVGIEENIKKLNLFQYFIDFKSINMNAHTNIIILHLDARSFRRYHDLWSIRTLSRMSKWATSLSEWNWVSVHRKHLGMDKMSI